MSSLFVSSAELSQEIQTENEAQPALHGNMNRNSMSLKSLRKLDKEKVIQSEYKVSNLLISLFS